MAQKSETSLGKYERCRVIEIGLDNFAECLKKGPPTCSYAVPFGYCFLCSHPRVSEMVENTKHHQVLAVARP